MFECIQGNLEQYRSNLHLNRDSEIVKLSSHSIVEFASARMHCYEGVVAESQHPLLE